MADKKQTPSLGTPLLLMPGSQGLTLNPPEGPSLFRPVLQSEPPLLAPEEEGEVDSFLGQTPPQPQPISYFQQSPPGGSSSDPFANLSQPNVQSTPPFRPSPGPVAPVTGSPAGPRQPPHTMQAPGPPAAVSLPGTFSVPPMNSGTPPPPAPASTAAAPPNQYRMTGAPRYAAPPSGMYANSPPSTGGPLPPPPTSSPPGASVLQGPPPLSGSPPGMMPQVVTEMGPVGPPPTMSSPTSGQPFNTLVPVTHHWFYCTNVELQPVWKPLSILDSIKLEDAFQAGPHPGRLISVEGGRYDINVHDRTRHAVYWEENVTPVRRCSWFYKGESDNRFLPYEENFAVRLEDEYRKALTTNSWHKRIELEGGEMVIIHNPNVIVHFKSQPDEWGTVQGDAARPRVVKRGIEEFDNIEDGEPQQVDHLVFVVHGIGPTCDLRFRNIVECVDDFRGISLQLLRSHFRSYQEEGRIGRVEFLPVRWHAALHGDATGIDRRLKAITLQSIGKLRHYTNDTLLDILLYASPVYCQRIVETVGGEMNRLYELFCSRNPGFSGSTSVAGHSLGSLIVFDLLSNQNAGTEAKADLTADTSVSQLKEATSRESLASGDDSLSGKDVSIEEDTKDDAKEEETLSMVLSKLNLSEFSEAFAEEKIDMESVGLLDDSDLKNMGLAMGPRKKLQGYVKLQKAKQKKKKDESEKKARQEAARQKKEEALRQLQQQQEQDLARAATRNPLLRQASSTSVSYVVSESGMGLPLVKYPQLHFTPLNFFALGSPIAMFQTVRGVQSLGENFRLPNCPGFFNIFHPFDPVAYRMEPLLVAQPPPKPVQMPHHKGRKRLHLELKDSLSRMGADLKQRIIDSVKVTWRTINDFAQAHRSSSSEITDEAVSSALSQIAAEQNEETASVTSSMPEEDVLLGQLNQGRRVDYVLQEKPIESFNDYLFALGSHACYWESEDTILMIVKEIYALQGIGPTRPGQHNGLPPPVHQGRFPGGAQPSTSPRTHPSPPSAPLPVHQGLFLGSAQQSTSPPTHPSPLSAPPPMHQGLFLGNAQQSTCPPTHPSPLSAPPPLHQGGFLGSAQQSTSPPTHPSPPSDEPFTNYICMSEPDQAGRVAPYILRVPEGREPPPGARPLPERKGPLPPGLPPIAYQFAFMSGQEIPPEEMKNFSLPNNRPPPLSGFIRK